MSKEFALNVSITANGTTLPDARVSIVSGGGLSVDETIPAPSTDLTVAGAIDVSQLKAFVMLSDVSLTVHRNAVDGTAYPLTAGVPFFWTSTSGLTNPLAADIAEFHVVLGGSTAARLQMEFVYDPTV